MELMVIENIPEKALQFEKCGVDRIFIDLEILGKDERQGHLNTVISRHSIDDVKAVKKVLTKSKLLVRVNPMNPDSEQEIKKAIAYGADELRGHPRRLLCRDHHLRHVLQFLLPHGIQRSCVLRLYSPNAEDDGLRIPDRCDIVLSGIQR